MSRDPGILGNGTPNGWARLVGLIGVPGVIAFYLIWWITQTLDARLARIIVLLEHIARAVRVSGP